jgi:lipid II:glycine glycyltransferase (peptidoglycan interpeptide bridge formation enzyme)
MVNDCKNSKIFLGTKQEWNLSLTSQENFSFYQCFEWGEVKQEEGWKVYRFYLNSCKIQLLIKPIKFSMAIAWIPGGVTGQIDQSDFDFIKKNLPYVIIYWRFSSNISTKLKLPPEFSASNFKISAQQSIVISLSSSEEQLRANLSKNWRHNLSRCEKKSLQILLWENPNPQELIEYYRQFEEQKNLSGQWRFQTLVALIQQFGNQIKIHRAFDSHHLFLGLRGSVQIGERAWDLFAITSNAGRTTYAAYGLLWHQLLLLKKNQAKIFDFGGVDLKTNSGVFNFKKGTGGQIINYSGEFDYSFIPGIKYLIKMLKKLRQ